jgi:ribokinase
VDGVRVVVVGSVNIDLVTTVAYLPASGQTVTAGGLTRVPGGKGANQALAAQRLGAEVSLVAAVGTDPAADEALTLLRADGVDLARVRVLDGASTGLALITVDADGDNTIVVVPGANAHLQIEPTDVAGADAVVCQLEVPMQTVVAAARGCPPTALFCLNTAPAAAVPDEVLRRADLVVANAAERAAVPGLEQVRLLAVTAGAEDAALFRPGGEIARVRPPKVAAVDGTGAGDAFVAALTVGLLAGRDPTDALYRACAAGAAAAARPGAQPSLPTRADVDALLGSSVGPVESAHRDEL